MSTTFFSRYSHWLLPTVAAATLLAVGARLITVSVHTRAEQMRAAAQTAAVGHARSINLRLRILTDQARGEAARVATAMAGELGTLPPASLLPERGTFWMTSGGSVIRAPEADAAVASAVASEWTSSGASGGTATVLFGPVRYGSQWIVAVRAASDPGARQDGAAAGLWAVSFQDLDTLLQRANFGTLVNEGYDFQLYQLDPASHQARVLLSSQPSALPEPAVGAIGGPAGVSNASTSDYLQLAIVPRTGWYPARELATEVGLLAVLTWALAFGMYDLTHSLKRSQAVLGTTRKRLHTVNQRLANETEQRESLQKSFEHARYHDTFTGLPNRRYFMDQLDRALRDVRTRRRARIAIILIDIERLKLIGDTLGHTAGDELLLQAAQRCAKALAGTAHLLARWGVDQLAVLIYEVESAAAAQALADRLQQVRQEPFELRQHRISVTSRVGFSCIDSGLQRAEDALREADLSLSVAKERQSEPAVAYAPGMAGAAVSLVSLEADLHVALDRNEFRLLFQPIVDLRGQRVVGVEALLRWRHPVEGLLTPDRFLAIAEEAGVIVPITRWVIQRVCRLAAEWRQRLPRGANFYISVNLSEAVLRAPGLREYVAQALAATHIPPRNLKFELAEGGLVSNVSTAREVLDGFHDMGIELMLDDFGTGYSSLSYLQLFPFDYVKIDRPFVSRTGSERANNAITAAILQMASSLGLRAIAEIVETKAAAQALVQMGCQFAQGYFFSAPVEAEEAFRQLRQGSTASDADWDDDSPTMVLPEGVILESRIRDDSDAPEEEGSSAR
jgi:diguanylate cyclase (GGDEF)-like protein